MDQDLNQFTRENLLKSVQLSEGAFDKNLNFISAGALLLSISFLDKLVPIREAVHKGVLISAWGLLIAFLIVNVFAHWLASRNAMKTLFEHDRQNKNTMIDSQRRNRRMNCITTSAALCMASGLICLIIYCSINLYNMPEDKKEPGRSDEGKFAVPSYVPPSQANPPIPSNPPTPPPPPPKEAPKEK